MATNVAIFHLSCLITVRQYFQPNFAYPFTLFLCTEVIFYIQDVGVLLVELETQIGYCVVKALVEIVFVYIFQISAVRCELNFSLLCNDGYSTQVGFFTVGIL